METVFITGGTGFIGRELLREMVKSEEVKIILCLYRSIIPFMDKKIYWLQGDMDGLPDVPDGVKVTKIIHCAAIMERGNRPKSIYKSNIQWTKNVIEFCRKVECKEIILFSSINVRLKHCGSYAKSKRACEQLIRESNLRIKIIRPALVFGKGENGITSLMNYIQNLPVVPVFGDGHAKEQPIYVKDLAKLTVKYVLDANAEEVVEFCGKEPMEYDEIVQRLAEQVGKAPRIIHLPFTLFYYGLYVLEKMNITLPISAEQVAHIAENLSCDMHDICERYQISLIDFREDDVEIF